MISKHKQFIGKYSSTQHDLKILPSLHLCYDDNDQYHNQVKSNSKIFIEGIHTHVRARARARKLNRKSFSYAIKTQDTKVSQDLWNEVF